MRFSYGALPFVLAAVVLVSGSPASPIVDLDTVTPTATVTLGGCGPELFTTTYDSFTITYCKPTVITGSGAATATTVTPVITSSTAAVTSFVNNDGTYTSFPPLTATVTLGCDPTPTLHTTTYDSFTITYCDATSTITPLPPYCSTYLACDPTPTFLTTTYDTFTITYFGPGGEVVSLKILSWYSFGPCSRFRLLFLRCYAFRNMVLIMILRLTIFATLPTNMSPRTLSIISPSPPTVNGHLFISPCLRCYSHNECYQTSSSSACNTDYDRFDTCTNKFIEFLPRYIYKYPAQPPAPIPPLIENDVNQRK
ncbi:hypothetical protein Moror_11312 [Moniliophthora roreri MCA 2997]|uniref:Uncharacterized protein n=1 Tax=Moniliophthora roreri (strain MCA 2997) TaxID=1381753 RepID=V2WUP4_MONRO|nr:hypothetical protein Moror_11312 [Moniliophthora roreri MCA 2997]